jgi:hypothetical protein
MCAFNAGRSARSAHLGLQILHLIFCYVNQTATHVCLYLVAAMTSVAPRRNLVVAFYPGVNDLDRSRSFSIVHCRFRSFSIVHDRFRSFPIVLDLS